MQDLTLSGFSLPAWAEFLLNIVFFIGEVLQKIVGVF